MNTIIIASGPVIVRDNKVLLDISGADEYWKFCGGRVKDGMDLRQTASSRAREELGIDLNFIDNDPFILFVEQEKPEGKADVLLVHWLADFSGEIRPGDMVRDWRWIPLAELDKYDLAPNIVPVLKHYKYI